MHSVVVDEDVAGEREHHDRDHDETRRPEPVHVPMLENRAGVRGWGRGECTVAFHVLFVCTGNVCRSPMAERLLAARLGESAGVTVSSAGTRALAGYAMDAPSAAVLRELGGDPTGHVARQLGPDELAAADLVLATDSANRGIVVRERPAVLHRAFTLREFARLSAGRRPGGRTPGR